MKAVVLESKRHVVCKDIEKPTPGANEVLVRVAYCGVCGSDVPRYLNGAVHFFPLVLGHEFSGVVEEVGEGADRTLLGKRVVGIPLIPCMECEDCKRGDYALCKNYSFVGSRRNGAYAEYVALPARNVYPIGNRTSDLEAAFFEPATVAQHALELVRVRPNTYAAVAGCGTIGIFLAQILQSLGVHVVALARRDVRIDAAKAAGVKTVVNTSPSDWMEQLLSTLPRKGFDYVFDTSGNNEMMKQSLMLVANKGTLCFVGTPKSPLTFTVAEWETINRREMTLTGSWMSYSAPFPGDEWSTVADLFDQGVLHVADSMIDSIYSLDTVGQGLEKFANVNTVKGKLVIKCS